MKEERCPECHAAKLVYDANTCEVICSVCGLVVDNYVVSIDSSDFEENSAFLDEMYGLGNPSDDLRFLKFMRKKVNFNGK